MQDPTTGFHSLQLIGVVLAILQFVMAATQIFVIPFLRAVAADVKLAGQSVGEMKISLAEMKAADQLASSIAQQALEKGERNSIKLESLNTKFQYLLIQLAAEGKLRPGSDEFKKIMGNPV